MLSRQVVWRGLASFPAAPAASRSCAQVVSDEAKEAHDRVAVVSRIPRPSRGPSLAGVPQSVKLGRPRCHQRVSHHRRANG